MRAKSTRMVLLTGYPPIENPGGIYVPSRIQTLRRVTSNRTAIWDIIRAEFPGEEEVCTLTHITYSGTATWCGFTGFFTYTDGITPRFLTKTIKGANIYINGDYPQPDRPNWYNEKDEIFAEYRTAFSSNDPVDYSNPAAAPHLSLLNGIESYWYGQAAFDPEDGCSLANNLRSIRRTNGNPYAFLMAYGLGPSYLDAAIADPNNIWVSSALQSGGQVVSGYESQRTIGPSLRESYLVGNTYLGNQLGTHTGFGVVRELLGNENTLFNQLKMDGAVVSSTQSSTLTSFNDSTGVFTGTLSAFQIPLPDSHNILGVEYTVAFTVSVTTGAITTQETATHGYTGDGTISRILEIPIPVNLPGTSVSLSSECVRVYQDFVGYNDFEAEPNSAWLSTTSATEKWPQVGRFICGTPSLVGADDFDSLADTTLGGTILDTDSAKCWGRGRFFQPTDIIGWHEFDSIADGGYNVTPGAIGFRGLARVFIYDNPIGYSTFDGLADGEYTETNNIFGFTELGRFFEENQPFGRDDFDSIADGTYSTTPQAEGFAGVGRFFVIP